MVGQLGSTFKDSEGGVSDWIKFTSTKRLAFFAVWPDWVVQIKTLFQNGYASVPNQDIPI